MAHSIVFQGETGGQLEFSFTIDASIVSGYVVAVAQDQTAYWLQGTIDDSTLVIAKSAFSAMPVGHYIVLPQVVDSDELVYFLDETEIDVGFVPGATSYTTTLPSIFQQVAAIQAAIASGLGVSDHGQLTGLADDDHPQYLNQTRSDARYYTKTQVDATVTNLTAIDDALLSEINSLSYNDLGNLPDLSVYAEKAVANIFTQPQNIETILTSDTFNYTLNILSTLNDGGNHSHHNVVNIFGYVPDTSAGPTSLLRGLNVGVESDRTVTELYGASYEAYYYGPGQLTNLVGQRARFDIGGDGGATNAYGFWVYSPGKYGSGNYTNLYGLKIDDLADVGATNTYAIHTGTGKVRFGDVLSIGPTANNYDDGFSDIVHYVVDVRDTLTASPDENTGTYSEIIGVNSHILNNLQSKPSGQTLYSMGGQFSARTASTSLAVPDSLQALAVNVLHYAHAATDSIKGLALFATIGESATTTDFIGIDLNLQKDSLANITNSIGIRIPTIPIGSALTRAIQIADQGSNYAIHTGTGKVQFGDEVILIGALTLPVKSANTVFAGPSSGASAAPAFRSLVAADIPIIAQNQVTNLTSDLGLKAPLASPAFTGTPTVPTATVGTNTTQAANTAFVTTAINNLINAAPGALDTLGEIAAQLANDESAVSALTTTVAGKQPLDADLTAIAALTGTGVLQRTGTNTWAVAALVAADIPNLSWSKITSGLPTTVSGYGITDAYTMTAADTRYGLLASGNVWLGNQTLRQNAIGTTSTDAILLENTTAATVGAQQWSPRLHWRGQGWKTNATAASQTVDWIAELVPTQGTANPSAELRFSYQTNGGGYVRSVSLVDAGYIRFGTSDTGFGLGGGNQGQIGVTLGGTEIARFVSVAEGFWLGSSVPFKWSAGNFGSSDIALRRNASNVLAVDNGTAGRWAGLIVGSYDGATATVSRGLTVAHVSSGTPANSFGNGILFNLHSSTTVDQNAAAIDVIWTDATHASRTSALVFNTVNNAGTLTERLRIAAAGVDSSVAITATQGGGFLLASSWGKWAIGGGGNALGYAYGVDITNNGNGVASPLSNSNPSTGVFFNLRPTINQSLANAYTAIGLDVTETAIGSGTSYLLNLKVGGVSRYTLGRLGDSTQKLINTGTASVDVLATLGHNSSGTAANGFGSRMLWQLQSSTTADQDAAAIDVVWSDATHATRTSKVSFQLVSQAGSIGERAAISRNYLGRSNSTAISVGESDSNDAYMIGNAAAAMFGTGALNRSILIGYIGTNTSNIPGADIQIGYLTSQSSQGTNAAYNIKLLRHTTLTNQLAASTAFTIKGAASQSANLQEWQNSSGTVLGYIDSNSLLNITASFALSDKAGVTTDIRSSTGAAVYGGNFGSEGSGAGGYVFGVRGTANKINATGAAIGVDAQANLDPVTAAITIGSEAYGVRAKTTFYSRTSLATTGVTGYGVAVIAPTVASGASSLIINNLYAFYAANQGNSSTTSAFGLFVAAQTGAINNYAIYTNAGQVRFGDAVTQAFTDSATNSVSTLQTLKHNTSGTPAAQFGSRLLWQLQSDTTADQDAAYISVNWGVATHASRSSRIEFGVVNSAAAAATVLTINPTNVTIANAATFTTGNAGIVSDITSGSSVSLFAHTSSGSPPVVMRHRAGTASDGTVQPAIQIDRRPGNTTGAGNGAGSRIMWTGSTTTNNAQDMAYWDTYWVDSTHASRKARSVFTIYDTTSREALRLEANGTVAMIGFLGASAVIRQVITGSRSDGTAFANLLTALANLGLITDSTTA